MKLTDGVSPIGVEIFRGKTIVIYASKFPHLVYKPFIYDRGRFCVPCGRVLLDVHLKSMIQLYSLR